MWSVAAKSMGPSRALLPGATAPPSRAPLLAPLRPLQLRAFLAPLGPCPRPFASVPPPGWTHGRRMHGDLRGRGRGWASSPSAPAPVQLPKLSPATESER